MEVSVIREFNLRTSSTEQENRSRRAQPCETREDGVRLSRGRYLSAEFICLHNLSDLDSWHLYLQKRALSLCRRHVFNMACESYCKRYSDDNPRNPTGAVTCNMTGNLSLFIAMLAPKAGLPPLSLLAVISILAPGAWSAFESSLRVKGWSSCQH